VKPHLVARDQKLNLNSISHNATSTDQNVKAAKADGKQR